MSTPNIASLPTSVQIHKSSLIGGGFTNVR